MLRFGANYAQHPRHWTARQVFFLTLSAAALVLLGVYHGYWTRGGDSEFYLAAARSLARGEGYRYNGQPVGLVPPGWPLLLAGGMWVTSSIALLKLILLGSILIYLGSAFHVLRRYSDPWWAAAATLAMAVAQPTWQLSMWFFSDAPFLAASWLALLLAMQARETWENGGHGLRLWLRVIAVLALLAAAISMRWAGILWWPMIALAFLDGRPLRLLVPASLSRGWRRLDSMWLAALLAGAVAIATFFCLRAALAVDPADIDPRYGAFEATGYDLINQTGEPGLATYRQRVFAGPQWLGVVWWNLAARTRPFREVMFFIAALTVVPLAAAGLAGLARRQWLWLGAAIAWLPVIATWPHAVDRYTMPVAPLLALGTMLGTAWLWRRLREPISSGTVYAALAAGLAALLWSATWLVGSYAWDTLWRLAPSAMAEAFVPVQSALRLPEGMLSGRGVAIITALVLCALLAAVTLAAARQRPGEADGRRRLPVVLRNVPLWLVAPAAIAFALYNATVYAVEVWVSRDPARRHEAGAQKALASIGHYLRINDTRVYPGELAVAPVRATNGVRYETLGPRRKAVFLADRPAVDVPYELSHEPRDGGTELDEELVAWLRQRDVRWYIVMPMQSRFIHFSRPPWESAPEQRRQADWRLYEITFAGARRVEVRDQPGEVLVVPGLED